VDRLAALAVLATIALGIEGNPDEGERSRELCARAVATWR